MSASGSGDAVGGPSSAATQTPTKKEKIRRPLSPRSPSSSSSTTFQPLFPRASPGGGRSGNGDRYSSQQRMSSVSTTTTDDELDDARLDDEENENVARKSELPMTKEVFLAFVRSSPVLLLVLFVSLAIVAGLLLTEESGNLSSSLVPRKLIPSSRTSDVAATTATAYLVLVTVPLENFDSDEFARELLEKRLVACVSAMSSELQSSYWWKGKIESSRERQLILKTTQDKLMELEREIKRKHPYELPEILHLPVVGGSAEYLQWLSRSVGQTSTTAPL